MNPDRIMGMASAFYDSCVLFAAVDAGVFSLLSEKPGLDSDEVAAAGGLNPRGCRLLLDACVATGLLRKEGGMYFNSHDASAFLVPGSAADLSGALRYNRDVYQAWGRLPELVRTGRPVERPEVHLGEDFERTRRFVLAMHHRALAIGRAVVDMVNLAGCRAILDVGGGPGTYSLLFAEKYDLPRCRVIDLPEVIKVARSLAAAHPAGGRLELIAGDYHTTPFPGENDAVLFFGVLHQESPDSIKELFDRAARALRRGGKLYVLDLMTDASHTSPRFSALFAVNMALTTDNGWVFSDDELKDWLNGAGFTDFSCRPLPAPMPHWLASARKK
jgi:ubiquinone/menaquinone biosynthesis C-methylase UbiE